MLPGTTRTSSDGPKSGTNGRYARLAFLRLHERIDLAIECPFPSWGDDRMRADTARSTRRAFPDPVATRSGRSLTPILPAPKSDVMMVSFIWATELVNKKSGAPF